MPESLKNLFNQDLDVPFMFGLAAQAKAFIIDRAIITLIVALMAAASSSGVLIYIVHKTQDDVGMLLKRMDELALSQNTIKSDMSYVRRDIDAIAIGFEKHLDGHQAMIIR